MSGRLRMPPGIVREEKQPRISIRTSCALNKDGQLEVAAIIQRGESITVVKDAMTFDATPSIEHLQDLEKLTTLLGDTFEKALATYFRKGFGGAGPTRTGRPKNANPDSGGESGGRRGSEDD